MIKFDPNQDTEVKAINDTDLVLGKPVEGYTMDQLHDIISYEIMKRDMRLEQEKVCEKIDQKSVAKKMLRGEI